MVNRLFARGQPAESRRVPFRPGLKGLETQAVTAARLDAAVATAAESADAIATGAAGNIFMAGQFRGSVAFYSSAAEYRLISTGGFDLFL